MGVSDALVSNDFREDLLYLIRILHALCFERHVAYLTVAADMGNTGVQEWNLTGAAGREQTPETCDGSRKCYW